MKIGYLVPEFPGQTHAFFWRELTAIEEGGTSVQILSTRRPPSGACPHDFGPVAANRTRYLFPPRPARALGFLVRHPVRAARALSYVMGLAETPVSGRVRLLALIPSAADLAAECRAGGVAHVHIHSCANAAHLGALANILDDLPYSLTLHGDMPVYGTDHAAKMVRARFVSAVTRPLAGSITAMIPDKDAPVIWMGVDTDRFRPRQDARDLSTPFTVATVARLNHMKGHRFFLQALARLRDEGLALRYVIIGDGPEQAAIRAEIARLGLQDQVEMPGSLGEQAVLSALRSVDALALTSVGKGEAAPVTVMEAMACGLPVICSVIGGTPDMISDGEDGFLVGQEDVSAITDRLRRLATDPKLAARIGVAARQSALQKFDHRVNAGKLARKITGGA